MFEFFENWREKRLQKKAFKTSGTTLTCREYCEYVLDNPQIYDDFLRYCGKIILDPNVGESTKAPQSFWQIFWNRYSEGLECFNFKDYWLTRIEPESKKIQGMDATTLFELKRSFMQFCVKEGMPVVKKELFTTEKEWMKSWQKYCEKYNF